MIIKCVYINFTLMPLEYLFLSYLGGIDIHHGGGMGIPFQLLIPPTQHTHRFHQASGSSFLFKANHSSIKKMTLVLSVVLLPLTSQSCSFLLLAFLVLLLIWHNIFLDHNYFLDLFTQLVTSLENWGNIYFSLIHFFIQI